MKRTLQQLLFAVLLVCLLPTQALANASEPPAFTVLVTNPPADLSLSIQFPDGAYDEPIVLQKATKGWEAYYRFFLGTYAGSDRQQLSGALLHVSGSGGSFQCPLPLDSFSHYNTLVTLDVHSQTLTLGQPVWRVPMLVALRVCLTFLLEALVFFLFGYREKRSWIVFSITNLLTQITLNACFTGPGYLGYWIFGYVFLEILIFAVEMIAFSCLLREFKKGRAALCAFTANAASLVLGGFLISRLPI